MLIYLNYAIRRLTIAEEDEIYWERWRPQSGFIMPASWRGKHINIINEVFTDEKAAVQLAGQITNDSKS